MIMSRQTVSCLHAMNGMCMHHPLKDTPTGRILDVLRYLLKQYPAAHIVNVGLLPRQQDNSGLWPNSFTVAMEIVNVQLRVFASHDERVQFVDCSHVFLQPDESQVCIH